MGRIIGTSRFVAPPLIYLAAFGLMTYPLITLFSSRLYAGALDDGLLNVWNLWWINKAVVQLHTSPFHTHYLHYPQGVSLVGHTLALLNGLLAIPLLKLFNLRQTFNCLFVFSFVASGWSAFLLAYQSTKAWKASVVAGFVFSFSAYHYSHAQMGHLNLLSMEWIPLFALFWLSLMSRPRMTAALGASLMMFFNVLTDYYYAFYCVLLAIVAFVFTMVRQRSPLFFTRREYLLPLGAFGLVTAATSGPICFSLVRATSELSGVHGARTFSMDLVDPFLYGASLRAGDGFESWWEAVHYAYNMEFSITLGLSLTALVVYAACRRKAAGASDVSLWLTVLLFFAVLCLGPQLHVFGRTLRISMPYAWMEAIFPPLKASGNPIRMVVMVGLSAAILSAHALRMLFSGGTSSRLAAGLLLVLLLVESLPSALPADAAPVAGYANFLKGAPPGAVLDTTASVQLAQYYQTVHEKPLLFGFVARLSEQESMRLNEARSLILDARYDELSRKRGLRYVVLPGERNESDRQARVTGYKGARALHRPGWPIFGLHRLFEPANARLVFDDGQARVFELAMQDAGCRMQAIPGR